MVLQSSEETTTYCLGTGVGILKPPRVQALQFRGELEGKASGVFLGLRVS